MSSMFLPSITIAEPSPEMLRAIAAVMEQESVVINLNRRDVMQKIQDGLNDAGLTAAETPDPEILPSATTQDAPLGAESSVFAAPAKKRGRPPKTPVVTETPSPVIVAPAPAETTPEPSVAPVNPVVTMPNGIVLNAPVETPKVETVDAATAVAAYAKAFQIAGLVALAQREGVQKFTELPAERQQAVYQEMMQAVALGVAAA